MSGEHGRRGCVPRTDAVVLEIGFADLGLPRRPPADDVSRTKESKGFAFQKASPRTADIIAHKGEAFVSVA
jgi:hypothetical protein